jgi:hypothetical protein
VRVVDPSRAVALLVCAQLHKRLHHLNYTPLVVSPQTSSSLFHNAGAAPAAVSILMYDEEQRGLDFVMFRAPSTSQIAGAVDLAEWLPYLNGTSLLSLSLTHTPPSSSSAENEARPGGTESRQVETRRRPDSPTRQAESPRYLTSVCRLCAQRSLSHAPKPPRRRATQATVSPDPTSLTPPSHSPSFLAACSRCPTLPHRTCPRAVSLALASSPSVVERSVPLPYSCYYEFNGVKPGAYVVKLASTLDRHAFVYEAATARVRVSSLGDAESSLGDAESSLGDAESSLGDAKSSLGDAESSLGDAKNSHWVTLRALAG